MKSADLLFAQTRRHPLQAWMTRVSTRQQPKITDVPVKTATAGEEGA